MSHRRHSNSVHTVESHLLAWEYKCTVHSFAWDMTLLNLPSFACWFPWLLFSLAFSKDLSSLPFYPSDPPSLRLRTEITWSGFRRLEQSKSCWIPKCALKARKWAGVGKFYPYFFLFPCLAQGVKLRHGYGVSHCLRVCGKSHFAYTYLMSY